MKVLDHLVTATGQSPKHARALVMAGRVLVNDQIITSVHQVLKPDDVIRIKPPKPWVSRGAHKLLAALANFQIEVQHKICLDIGASTGGFTQVLLAHGATQVYALDVGTNQLDYRLRSDPRVVCLEKTNLKTITAELFATPPELVVCDVSFISLVHVFQVLQDPNLLAIGHQLVVLIKPQFEAPAKLVGPQGYVDPRHHQAIIDKIINDAQTKHFELMALMPSPILGHKSKNREYLALFRKVQ